jgi:cobalt/nickel transport system ATP-binding protein
MQPVLFDIDQLSHSYADGKVALKSISLVIEKGKRIALLGNNGAGKSTFFLHLNGILQPTSGAIRYQGKDVRYNRKSLRWLRNQVGLVFQDPDSQLFSASVVEDISFGPFNLGLSKEAVAQRVEWAMEQTETVELRDKPTHFLSVGQKKRVAIAGVLAMDPEVLILDEPTAGLDSYYSKQIMRVLEQVHEQEKTIIISTHDVNLAYQWADQIVVMHNGEILGQGDPVTVFQQDHWLQKAHLDKPWILETFEYLSAESLLSAEDPVPQRKEALLQMIKRASKEKS